MTTTTHPIAEALAIFATLDKKYARRGVPGGVVKSPGTRWAGGAYHLVGDGERGATACGVDIAGGWCAYNPWESWEPDVTCKRCNATPAGRERVARVSAERKRANEAYTAAQKARAELQAQRTANRRLLTGIAEVARLTDCARRAGVTLVAVDR